MFRSLQFPPLTPAFICDPEWTVRLRTELERASPWNSTATQIYWDVLFCQTNSRTATADLSIYELLVKPMESTSSYNL